ncbi:unnamed protein product [Ectocarpus sp. CCAP 1310/34]|nr:unnamed protein product [Ectocarpus sp. CCAP 1310/34]
MWVISLIIFLSCPSFDLSSLVVNRSDSMRQVEMKLTLEQHGLVVEYGTRGGGQVSPKKALHLTTGVDYLLIAHRQGDDFTYNDKVIPQKFDGCQRTDEGRHTPNTAAASVMNGVPYVGAKKRLSDNVAVWAIQRHTPNTAAASVMNGVPYVGAKKRLSDNVAVWAIQR